MRTKVHVAFNAEGHPLSRIRTILLDAGHTKLAEGGPPPLGLYTPDFWEDQPELALLRSALEHEGIESFERREPVFSERERREAALLRIIIRRTPKGYGGLTIYGNEYDLSEACPRCGTGAARTSPLSLKSGDLPKSGDIIETGAGEVLVSPLLGQVLTEAKVTGLRLDEVLAAHNQKRLSWLHLRSTFTMPRMSEASQGGEREDACPGCDRDGYFDSARDPLRIAYDADAIDLDRLPDIVHTWECFGNSHLTPPNDRYLPGARLAQPLVLTSPKVYDVFRRQKVRRLDFEPVEIVA
jgi:rRNA maturation protein Nop10